MEEGNGMKLKRVWHETEKGIARVAEDYIQELFTTSNLTTIEPVVENVDRVVTPLMN